MSSSPFSFVRKTTDSLCQSAKQRLRQWTKPDNHGLVLSAALDLTRSKQELVVLAEYSHPLSGYSLSGQSPKGITDSE